jgi:hypothetical protein
MTGVGGLNGIHRQRADRGGKGPMVGMGGSKLGDIQGNDLSADLYRVDP